MIIAIEGIDGSGKGLQYKRLCENLESKGYKIGKMDFPSYDDFYGKEIGRLLSGDDKYNAANTDVKSMSLWYAMDRMQAFNKINVSDYDYILLNRSTLSNAVYQGARCKEDEREEFIKWIDQLEFNQLNIPRPDLYIVFDVPPKQSKINVAKKGHRDYVGDKADVYESNSDFMSNVRDGYLKSEKIFNNVVVINCMGKDGMLPPETIENLVMEIIKKGNIKSNKKN